MKANYKGIRKCPKCGKNIHYHNKNKYSIKYTLTLANKRNTLCNSCQSKQNLINHPDIPQKLQKIFKTLWQNKDYREKRLKINPMYNGELKKGDQNPMYGKSIYSVWLKKYGKDIADQKQAELNKKRSLLMLGVKNHMYGIPSPQGAGNGWCGWYKTWFFRSLRELSYMINVIEKNNYNWKSAETKELTICYKDYKNNNHTYRADFLINNKFLVEIKPKKLFKSITVVAKQKAAEEFCNKHNLIYQLIDPAILSSDEIFELYQSKKIVFTDNYNKLFKERYL